MTKFVSLVGLGVIVIICLVQVTESWLGFLQKCNPLLDTEGYLDRYRVPKSEAICSPHRKLFCKSTTKTCQCDGRLLTWDSSAKDDRVKLYWPNETSDGLTGDCRFTLKKHCFVQEDCLSNLQCVNFSCEHPNKKRKQFGNEELHKCEEIIAKHRLSMFQ